MSRPGCLRNPSDIDVGAIPVTQAGSKEGRPQEE